MKYYILFFLILTFYSFSHYTFVSEEEEGLFYKYPEEIETEFAGCLDSTALSKCSPMAWFYSFIGEYKEAIKADNQKFQSSKRDSVLTLSKFELKEAYPYVLEGASNTSLVIFNEAHHRPEHRIYTADFLEDLYELGYRYLSLEGMKEEVDSLEFRGRPVIKTGFYPREPQFANMIRYALSLGYTVLPHDRAKKKGEGAERIKNRELAQAKCIAQIFEKDSLAKVVAHVGYGHIREDTAYYGGLMAYQFKKMTGINPLTVGQARYNSESKESLEHEYYRQYPDFNKVSTLIYKEDDTPYNDSIVDIDVFHPRIKDTLDRPHYLVTNERYKTHKFAVPKVSEFPILACLYAQVDGIDYLKEIPIDIVLIQELQDTVVLTSPLEEPYKVLFFDENKALINEGGNEKEGTN